MRFKIKTLVDITETKARKGEDEVRYGQQQNYMALLNTLGLRTNINLVGTSKVDVTTTKGFGSTYKGQHKVWTQEIDVEYEGATNIEFMQNDFDLVPIINNLEETAEFDIAVFRTKDTKKRNILFEKIEE